MELKRTIIGCKNKQNHQDVRQLHSSHTRPRVRKKKMIILFGAVKLFTPLTFQHGCISLVMAWGYLSNTYNLYRFLFWVKCKWPIPLGLNPPFPSTSSFVFKGPSCHSAKAELITLELPWNKVLVLKELELLLLATSECLLTLHRMWKERLPWEVGENILRTLEVAGWLYVILESPIFAFPSSL